jgi:thioredoxin-related protein
MRVYRTILIFSICFLGNIALNAQIKKVEFEQLDSLMQIEKKRIFVFIHTDWCRYCQKMSHSTFKKDTIVKLLNKHFYFVDFDAENQENVTFNGRVFKYKPTGKNVGTHALATYLADINGQVSYPTLCILNEKYEKIFVYPQYMNDKDLTFILNKYAIPTPSQ